MASRGLGEDDSADAQVGMEPAWPPPSPLPGMSGSAAVFSVGVAADDGGYGGPWVPLTGENVEQKDGGGGDDVLGAWYLLTLSGLVSENRAGKRPCSSEIDAGLPPGGRGPHGELMCTREILGYVLVERNNSQGRE